MKTQSIKIYLFSLSILLATAITNCGLPQNTIAEKFQPIPSSTWKWKDSKTFSFTVDDSTHYYNLSIGLRINGTYAYSNIWLISQLRGNNLNNKKQIQIELADQTGRWLGEGMSNLITYEKPIVIQQKLPIGTYTWSLSQNMRDESLQGVSDIGIKVEKGQPIL